MSLITFSIVCCFLQNSPIPCGVIFPSGWRNSLMKSISMRACDIVYCKNIEAYFLFLSSSTAQTALTTQISSRVSMVYHFFACCRSTFSESHPCSRYHLDGVFLQKNNTNNISDFLAFQDLSRKASCKLHRMSRRQYFS